MRPSITYLQARKGLRRIAEFYPMRTTKFFEYYDQALRPLCIVSHLMEAYGVDAERVRRIAQVEAPTVRILVETYGAFYTCADGLVMLSRVQTLEDQGYTWQDAIEEGVKHVKREGK